MTNERPLLARMRRHRRLVATALLPVLATVWVGSAAACVGMAGAHEAGEHLHVAHRDADAPHDRRAAHDGHGVGHHDADGAGHLHDAVHASEPFIAPHGSAGHPALSDGGGPTDCDCPLCVGVADSLPAAARFEHASCGSVDSPALAKTGPSGQPDWPPLAIGPPHEPAAAAAIAASRYVDRAGTILASGVALHLRHCVLLL